MNSKDVGYLQAVGIFLGLGFAGSWFAWRIWKGWLSESWDNDDLRPNPTRRALLRNLSMWPSISIVLWFFLPSLYLTHLSDINHGGYQRLLLEVASWISWSVVILGVAAAVSIPAFGQPRFL